MCIKGETLPVKGTWCSGITSASHAKGPGFKSQCVHLFVGHPARAALTDASSIGQSVALPLASYSVRQDASQRGRVRQVAGLLEFDCLALRWIVVGCLCLRCRRPHRLVVRTSRRGRDNPGSTPGAVIITERFARSGLQFAPRKP